MTVKSEIVITGRVFNDKVTPSFLGDNLFGRQFAGGQGSFYVGSSVSIGEGGEIGDDDQANCINDFSDAIFYCARNMKALFSPNLLEGNPTVSRVFSFRR